jgi:hypothetical protein
MSNALAQGSLLILIPNDLINDVREIRGKYNDCAALKQKNVHVRHKNETFGLRCLPAPTMLKVSNRPL